MLSTTIFHRPEKAIAHLLCPMQASHRLALLNTDNKIIPMICWKLTSTVHACIVWFQNGGIQPGLCSSRAQWPLVPNFFSWATRKSQIFHTNHYAGHSGFYGFRALGSLLVSLEHSLVQLTLAGEKVDCQTQKRKIFYMLSAKRRSGKVRLENLGVGT